MANENLKKFLDSAGVSHLWTKIDNKVKSEIAKEAERIDNKIGVVPNDANGNARTVVKYVQDLTDGVATSGVVSELQTQVGKNKDDIKALQDAAANYLTEDDLSGYETTTEADKVRERVGILEQYKTTNDAALDVVRTTANNAATKTDVEKALEGKADQTEFAIVKGLVDNFFADEAQVDEKLDQLKEIVTYLNTHEGVASGIVEDVAAIETKVNNLLNMGKVPDSETDYTVTAYVADAINARLDIGDKTVKQYVANIIGNLGDKTDVVAYIDAAISSFKNGDFAAATEDIGKLEEAVEALQQAIENLPEVPSLEGYATEGYVQNYVAEHAADYVIALTNAEIDTAIGAAQTTN